MLVRVLLFGPQARLAGSEAVDVSIDQPKVTAETVLAALGEQHTVLQESIPSSRLAINHEFAGATDPVGPSDELALIGMVSGG